MAAIALLLPTSWTGRFISLVQILAPFQHAATSAADSLGGAAEGASAAQLNVDAGLLSRQKEALTHQVVALSARVADLEREVAILTASRFWDAAGRRIGATGQLIPAAVVVGDLLPWRSSTLVNAGSLQGVPRGAPVLSNFFTIELGPDEGMRGGLAVLLGETLIGWVDQVGTHTSRVKLLTDTTVEMKVRIGRVDQGKFTLAEDYYWLTGHGGGLMQIRDVTREDVESGAVRTGDLVLSDPANPTLPAALTIGTVREILPDRKNPLLSILVVEPSADPAALRRVYVFDPQTAPEPSP